MSTQARPRRSQAGAVLVLALVLVAGARLAASGAPAQVAMQRYQDPQKTFSIDYPRGWKAARLPNGSTAFYLDDPAEGTAFVILPNIELGGVQDAAALWRDVAADLRRRAPDWTQSSLQDRAGEGGQRSVEARYTWTNLKGIKMQGWILFTTQPAPSRDRTYAGMVSYQASAREFAAWEAVFRRMLASLAFGR